MPVGLLMIMLNHTAAEAPSPLRAVIEKLNRPAAVGVPGITPVEALNVSHVGSLPEATAHVAGLFEAASSIVETLHATSLRVRNPAVIMARIANPRWHGTQDDMCSFVFVKKNCSFKNDL